MTYNKTIWVDQEVKKERTYELINNSDGTTTIQDPPNNILTFGTPVNAQNLNNIENGIEDHEIRISLLEGIGNPIPTLSNILGENEIWLEGAEISRTTYAALFEIYGTTYGEGDGSTTFNLPDFRNRAIWGAEDFGYIEAGLPNITGSFQKDQIQVQNLNEAVGCISSVSSLQLVYVGGGNLSNEISRVNIDASRSSSIYGNSTTVQPPSVKVRVKTRYA